MRKKLLLVGLLAFVFSFNGMSQCGQISLIGEFNAWAGDHNMTRNMENPDLWWTYLTVTEEDDTDSSGFVDLKFRENADWVNNWGDTTFPSGTAFNGGPNIPVPAGTYKVTFNCTSGEYNFAATCGQISMIGEFNGWSDDHNMTRNPENIDMWWTTITVTEEDDTDSSGFVDLKFRQDADWGTNWGDTTFPTGIAYGNGPNIPVPAGNYKVTFNCATGEYNFIATCGEIGIIGEFNGWSADYPMLRNPQDPDVWHTVLTLYPDSDTDTNGVVELKFRQNADWGVNWGDSTFPIGTAIHDGPNIPVPLDDVGTTTDYLVQFNCSTGAYIFIATSGQMGILGDFNGWNNDVPMWRDRTVPNLWHLTRRFTDASGLKFRENMDWTANWGSADFPSGTGEDNGPNIPLTAGTYDVTFNYTTKEYNFVTNADVCGEIGMVGDFNNWGNPDNSEDPATDVYLVRDPMYPSQFSLEYNFTASTKLLFRMDALPIMNDNVWGGTFPCGTGVHDVTQSLDVPGGKYNITFNCKSGDFCFERLGNAVIAPKVFAITVDGDLSDSDWNIDQNISRIVDGTVTEDLNVVDFGVTYNQYRLYVGMNVVDGILGPDDSGEIFIDGNKSGGDYDEFDLHLKFGAGGIEVIWGPEDIVVELGFKITGTGYSSEVAIPWDAIGVTPVEGDQIGLDIFIHDDDTPTEAGADYTMAWNGGLENYETTSGFGDMVFGILSCGCISVYNETIGDVVLRNPDDEPTTYVGSYFFDDDFDLVFRKDKQGTVTWSSDEWPTGTATLGSELAIPSVKEKYRITFDCLTGEYTFSTDETVPGIGVALSIFTDTPANIDGDLSEYGLSYGSEIMNPETATNNNAVKWGTSWDADYMYVGVEITDAVVEWTNEGSPWENDAIEFYIDGNNDKDGPYDSEFDTQLIMDVNDANGLWIKADGVQMDSSEYEAIYFPTDNGYNIEMKLMWSIFDFSPGRNRTIGFSLGNNDSDNGVGRDYQTLWYGDGNNWSDTKILGDMQLSGGPYFVAPDWIDEDVLYNANLLLYPNPTNGIVHLRSVDDVFNGQVTILVADITGRIVVQSEASFNGNGSETQLRTDHLTKGIYFVNVLGQDGKRAVKKLIVH